MFLVLLMFSTPLRFIAFFGVVACQSGTADIESIDPSLTDGVLGQAQAASADAHAATHPSSCEFTYAAEFGTTTSGLGEHQATGSSIPWVLDGPVIPVAHPEPLPDSTWIYSLFFSTSGLTMPGYMDNMPTFERALEWGGETRCFETPNGARLLDEDEAWGLYMDIAELTTGVIPDTRDGIRTVVGIRGAFPGAFQWHGNAPNQFNDTLVLLWQENGVRSVREFPVNTDTGAVYFGYHSASSLRPNRRYTYTNGWHRSYNAPQMYEWGYRVADDSNGNGHWDRDRNGWRDGGAIDHERPGSAHNIHMASVDGPLGKARVENWSAGCQVIPGIDNWTEFVTQYWTDDKDITDYFLIDARDIDHRVWTDCTPNGSHECPYEIESFPFTSSANTRTKGFTQFDQYNCSSADESGPEIVYFFTVDREGTLSVEVDSQGGSDIDIHLMDGDDPNACLERDHTDFNYNLSPGRYYIIADSWVDGSEELSGAYTLRATFQ